MTGRIFEIREFTLHDGPGIRTTVFLKGCPLHCAWCHNPEGQKFEKETMRRRDGTLVPCGIDWDADALAEELLINADIMQQSGGGVTFSGGEPLAQAEFVRAVAGKLKAHGIHLAVETSGCVAPECYRAVASCMDFVYQDLKLGNSEDFRRWCGGSLETVLENIAWLRTSGIKFVFRTPLIPGVNDTPESKAAIAAIAAGAPHEWLPFNPAAGAKYPMLGRDWCLKETYPPFFFRK